MYELTFTLGVVLVTSIVSKIQFSETFPCFLENLLETGNNCIKKLHALHILKAVYPAVLDCLWLDWMCGCGLWKEGVEFNGKWLLGELDKKCVAYEKLEQLCFWHFHNLCIHVCPEAKKKDELLITNNICFAKSSDLLLSIFCCCMLYSVISTFYSFILRYYSI